MTEPTLVESMAQHHWLRRRALNLESACYDSETGAITDQKQLLSTRATKPLTSAPSPNP